MTNVYKYNNAIILNDGKIGISPNCCCEDCCYKAAGQSVTITYEGNQYVINFMQSGDIYLGGVILPITDINTNLTVPEYWSLSLVCENGSWNATILGPCFAPTFCQSEAISTLQKNATTCLPVAGVISWSGDLNNCDDWPPNLEPAPFPSIEIL